MAPAAERRFPDAVLVLLQQHVECEPARAGHGSEAKDYGDKVRSVTICYDDGEPDDGNSSSGHKKSDDKK